MSLSRMYFLPPFVAVVSASAARVVASARLVCKFRSSLGRGSSPGCGSNLEAAKLLERLVPAHADIAHVGAWRSVFAPAHHRGHGRTRPFEHGFPATRIEIANPATQSQPARFIGSGEAEAD